MASTQPSSILPTYARTDLAFERGEGAWLVTADGLASRGKNSPLLGMDLPGRVLLTMADGRIAYEAPTD